MYLKHITCNTKIFIELKNSRTFKNQGWKNTLFQEQLKTKQNSRTFKNIQGFQGPVATLQEVTGLIPAPGSLILKISNDRPCLVVPVTRPILL